MAGLQRSTISFRRQGSSGSVWDDRVLSGELDQMKQKEEGTQLSELKTSRSVAEGRTRKDHHSGSVTKLSRSQSAGSGGGGGGGRHGHRTERTVLPTTDPPSPKVSFCGFCGVFGKPEIGNRSSPGKRKS